MHRTRNAADSFGVSGVQIPLFPPSVKNTLIYPYINISKFNFNFFKNQIVYRFFYIIVCRLIYTFIYLRINIGGNSGGNFEFLGVIMLNNVVLASLKIKDKEYSVTDINGLYLRIPTFRI